MEHRGVRICNTKPPGQSFLTCEQEGFAGYSSCLFRVSICVCRVVVFVFNIRLVGQGECSNLSFLSFVNETDVVDCLSRLKVILLFAIIVWTIIWL
jgi:hypothetical protein